MGRWEPDAAGRLRAAALELFVERGYEQTTVPDIADRAGLTARTFFRYFADKREVLFAGSTELVETMLAALDAAPADATPMAAVAAAVRAAGVALGGHREYSRQRQALIAGNAELRERELIKLDALTTALTAGLRDRGVEEPVARLSAEAGMAVFRVGFDRWTTEPVQRELVDVMSDLLGRLPAITAVG